MRDLFLIRTVKPEDAFGTTNYSEFHQDGNIELPASNIDDNHWQNVPGQGNGNGVPQTQITVPLSPTLLNRLRSSLPIWRAGRAWSSFILEADNSSGDLNFSVERWTENNPKRYSITITTNQTYLDQQVEEGETYYYRVLLLILILI